MPRRLEEAVEEVLLGAVGEAGADDVGAQPRALRLGDELLEGVQLLERRVRPPPLVLGLGQRLLGLVGVGRRPRPRHHRRDADEHLLVLPLRAADRREDRLGDVHLPQAVEHRQLALEERRAQRLGRRGVDDARHPPRLRVRRRAERADHLEVVVGRRAKLLGAVSGAAVAQAALTADVTGACSSSSAMKFECVATADAGGGDQMVSKWASAERKRGVARMPDRRNAAIWFREMRSSTCRSFDFADRRHARSRSTLRERWWQRRRPARASHSTSQRRTSATAPPQVGAASRGGDIVPDGAGEVVRRHHRQGVAAARLRLLRRISRAVRRRRRWKRTRTSTRRSKEVCACRSGIQGDAGEACASRYDVKTARPAILAQPPLPARSLYPRAQAPIACRRPSRRAPRRRRRRRDALPRLDRRRLFLRVGAGSQPGAADTIELFVDGGAAVATAPFSLRRARRCGGDRRGSAGDSEASRPSVVP